MMKTCRGYKSDGSAGTHYEQGPHALEDNSTNFGPGRTQCRTCYKAYADDWRAKKGVGGSGRRQTTSRAPKQTIVLPDFRAPAMASAEGEEEFVSDEDLATPSHKYVPMPQLIETWGAVTNAAASGAQPFNMIFLGPSGSGKTEGGAFLAALVGLPFTKIDCASMTDPESWFGTREVIESEGGVSVTDYRPSAFVLAIQEPGVLLLDEVNRVGDTVRNILLPLLDGTHQVTNPLTGDVVVKHPRCFVIMTGNRGLNFTGTFAIDPALMSRSLVVPFDYPPQAAEIEIAIEASGCDREVAELFVRFAVDSRLQARTNEDMNPVSTREVLAACKLVKHGASLDLAADVVVMNAASDEGGAGSMQQKLRSLWVGIRNTSTLKRCATAHPTETSYDGEEITCAVEVKAEALADVATLLAAHPGGVHKALDRDGDALEWS